MKLLEMPPNRIPRHAYIMLCNLDRMGRKTWATSIKDILYSFGFGYAWISQEVGNRQLFLYTFEMRVKDVLKQRWTENLALKPKLRTYSQFKSLLEPEKYLHLQFNHEAIRMFTCFRCSVLPLAIEEGRRRNIAIRDRICKFCNTNSVEDEYHFLVICPMYNNLRLRFLPKDLFLEPNYQKFIRFMSSPVSDELISISNFVYRAFKLREKA